MKGKPVMLLTTVGARTGKIRKTPLMRVEHDGEYAVVASLGGAPSTRSGTSTSKANPRVELQDGTQTHDYEAREVFGDEKAHLVGARRRGLAGLRRLPAENRPPDPGVRADPDSLISPWRWHHCSVSAELSQNRLSPPLTAADIDEAARRIADVVSLSPLQHSERLSAATGAEVWLKREDLQTVRSYKLRGAYNLLAQLTDAGAARRGGVLPGPATTPRASPGLPDDGHPRPGLRAGQDPKQKRERIRSLGGEFVELIVGGETYDAGRRGRARGRRAHRRHAGAALRRPAHDRRPGHHRRRDPRAARTRAGPGDRAGRRRRLHRRDHHLPGRAHPDTAVVGVEPAGAASMMAALAAG